MIPEQLVKDTFQDLIEKYDLIIDIKSKMKFNIYSLDDLPSELKKDILERLQIITECIGRKRFELDHPIMINKSGKSIIRSGIWFIRIF